MRFGMVLGALFGAAILGYAQDIPGYLQVRKQHGISQAAGVPALETLLGKRVLEIEGTVKGTFSIGGRHSILLERTDGENEMIESKTLPVWIEGMAQVPVRIIVRAERTDETSALRAEMLAIAPESSIARVDEAIKRKTLAAARKSPPAPPPVQTVRGTKRPADWQLPTYQAAPYYAAFIRKTNPRLTNARSLEIANGIIHFALRYGVDARLIMAMVMTESTFDPRETSHAGAMGLGQLMPGTARMLGVSDPYDIQQNLSGTVRYIRQHLQKFGQRNGDYNALVLSLAAYNAGPGAVARHGGVPPFRETQNYVRRVIKRYRMFLGE